MNFKNNPWALVCGSSQGIGRATAVALSKYGVNVILLARSNDKLLKTQSELHPSSKSYVLAVDLSNIEDLKNQISEILKKTGPIEILINNSGGPKAGPILEAHTSDFLQGFTSHILASQTLAQLLIPGMKEKGHGRIINVISTSVKIPIPNLGVSNTIRGAMASWSKSLSNEVASWGITVNNVLPGFTETERLEILKEGSSQRLSKSKDEIERMWLESIPARRFASPQETAEAICFLASDQASYINGVSLPVDGGRTGSL
jgi:3-oxoacyl-[acyl-carrier protein] reductase